jgi:uncharacterized membrane protein HdeD (DUF308 family)
MSTSVPYPPDPYPPESYPSSPYDAAATTSDAAALGAAERAAWWLVLASAVTSVVLGIMMIAWPEATLKVVALLFGIWLLFHGLARIVQAITATAREGAERAILGVIGVLFVIAGVIALRNLFVSLAVVVTLIGLMWLIGGIVELVSAFTRHASGDRLWHVVLGSLSIVGALIVLVWPDLSLVALVYITGAWMVIMGLVQAALAVWARRSLTAQS